MAVTLITRKSLVRVQPPATHFVIKKGPRNFPGDFFIVRQACHVSRR